MAHAGDALHDEDHDSNVGWPSGNVPDLVTQSSLTGHCGELWVSHVTDFRSAVSQHYMSDDP